MLLHVFVKSSVFFSKYQTKPKPNFLGTDFLKEQMDTCFPRNWICVGTKTYIGTVIPNV
jgi:hypothetical protein